MAAQAVIVVIVLTLVSLPLAYPGESSTSASGVTSAPQIILKVSSCIYTASTGFGVCTLNLSNAGSSEVDVSACSLYVGIVKIPGNLGGDSFVPAGGAATTTCTIVDAAEPLIPSSTEVPGSLILSNGEEITFEGFW